MSWPGSGCSAANDPGDGISFEPFPGWPDDVAVRKVGDAPRTSITRLEVGPGDRSWLLRDDIDSDPADARPVVERYRRDGALDQRLTFPAGTRIPEMVVHPSGQLSLFVLAPDAATSPASCTYDRCPLAIVRSPPTGRWQLPCPSSIRKARFA